MSDHADDDEVIDFSLEPAPAPVGGRAGRPASEPGDRRRTPWVLAGLALLVVLVWGGVAAGQLTGVRTELFAARDELLEARVVLLDGDVAAANALVESAEARMAGVPGALSSPVVAPARLLPGPARTLGAVSDLAVAGEMAAGAVAQITGRLADGEGGLGALTPEDGRLPVDEVIALQPLLAEARAGLTEAQQLARDVEVDGVDAAVVDARAQFLELLEPLDDELDVAARAVDLIPALLGADGPRTYLIASANPTESRGSAGYFGAFTLLRAEDGRLSFDETEDTSDLPIIPRGTLPWPDESLGERYDIYGGSGYVRNINMTPDFPSVGAAIEAYWSESTGQELDGVLSVDPYAFEALLRLAGPIEVDGYGPVDADTVVEFVSREAYSVFTEQEERKRVIGEVAVRSLQGFLNNSGGATVAGLLEVLGGMVQRESLLVHAADPELQDDVVALGLAGELGDGADGDLLGVFLNSGTGFKNEYWLSRQLSYDVVLGEDGVGSAVLLGRFQNDAPISGEQSYMIGLPQQIVPIGSSLSLISVYGAPGTAYGEVPDTGYDEIPTTSEDELGFPVTSTWLELASGTAQQLAWNRTSPDVWQQDDAGRITYSLTYSHQPSIAPTEVTVSVTIPDGTAPEGLVADGVVEDGRVTISWTADRDRVLELVFSPAAS